MEESSCLVFFFCPFGSHLALILILFYLLYFFIIYLSSTLISYHIQVKVSKQLNDSKIHNFINITYEQLTIPFVC